MRIKSITVRNYRVHRELKVQLDDSRTLIGGPNECGKSTLVEAIHRGLFLKSKVTGDTHKSMVSTCFAGTPEVEIGFTAGGKDYVITKYFNGISGTTRLVQVGGSIWHGEEAETHLASLLKVGAISGGRGVGERVAQQWSHLWVWQGESGNDPNKHANLQKEDLLQRLQKIGGAAALQSELDSQVAARFAAAKNEIFTQAGKPKAGSDLEKADNEAGQAETNRQRAAEQVEELREAIRDFEDANQAIDRAAEDLRRLSLQKASSDAQISRVDKLRQQEAIQLPGATAAAEKYQALRQNDAQISELRVTVNKLETALLPENEKTAILDLGLAKARQTSEAAAQEFDRATDRARDSRLHRDFASACAIRFETEARLQELLAREERVRGYNEELLGLRRELAKLPVVTIPKWKMLQTLDLDANVSEASLRAMAAGIEVISASGPVRVGDASLDAGQSQVVTESTEVFFGELLCLRISPGGGTKLQEARQEANASRQKLRGEFDALGINSVAEAAEALHGRNSILAKIEKAEAALETLDAAHLAEILSQVRASADAAAAEVNRRATQVADITLPSNANTAKQWLTATEDAVEKAESEERQAKVLRDTGAKLFKEAQTSLSNHRQTIDQQKAELTGLNAKLQLLMKNHGGDVERAKALDEALGVRDSAQAELASTVKALAELQPELLAADQARLKRALCQASETKSGAEIKSGIAKSKLLSDGTDDPEATLALATARVRSAQDHLASVRRKAEAIRLLDELFLQEQRALAEQFTAPFAERISAYLQCLFGAGARAKVTLAENAFTGLELVRAAEGGGAVPFTNLSGGAREQVAAAVRLAMAEVLAVNYDGCLPLVFDDAFAYSDPDRVQTLQRMLERAAFGGMQLIILTCNPSDYAALGAIQITLRQESINPAFQKKLLPNASSEPTPEAPETDTNENPVAEEQCLQLLAKLAEMGGKSGNVSLRKALVWNEILYNAVKEHLVAANRLMLGRGQGGSVFLPTT